MNDDRDLCSASELRGESLERDPGETSEHSEIYFDKEINCLILCARMSEKNNSKHPAKREGGLLL